MINTLNCIVNITTEAVMIAVLSLFLLVCLRQGKRFSTTLPLTFLTIIVVSSLVVQIITWFLIINDAQSKFGLLPMKIVYTLDYIFAYIEGVTLYIYVESLAKESYKYKGIEYKDNSKIIKYLTILGIFTSLIYAVFINFPFIYRIENGIFYYNILAYIAMHIVVKVPCFCSLAKIMKHKKVFKKHEATIISCFIFIPMVFIIVDETYGSCISYLMMSFFTLALYIRIDLERELLIEEQERNLIERQTEIMLSQMQPHFLYNVLTTISALCEKQNAIEARDVTNRFADYFRVNLDSLGNDKTIPFTKELDHIETYLWLEKVRFADYLNINYEIGPKDFSVPSLSLQPIVENAVKHGILPKETPGTLTIKTAETDKDYLIIIEDDGVGFDAGTVIDDGKSHVGIENVKRRLEIICGGSLTVTSERNKGTIVTVSVPKVIE